MTESEPLEGAPDSASPLRWWHRAVPVGLLALAGTGVVALALPAEEVDLSTTRQAQEFVELHLTEPPRAACRGARSLQFRVVSHFTSPRLVRYRIGIDPAGRNAERVHKRGKVRLLPGEAATVRTRLGRAPARAHHITVRVPQRPEQLRIRCAGTRR